MAEELQARSASRPPEVLQPPPFHQGGRLRPRWRLVSEGRERGRGVHGRDSSEQPQLLRLRREASGFERRLERAVLGEQRRRRLRPDAFRARQLVGRVAAERDEVGHLLRLDAVALAHLGRTDARDLAHAARRLQDRRALARELEEIAIRGRDEDGALLLLLGCDDGAHEVVRFVARRLRRREPERLDELGQQVELLEQVVLEDATGLIRGERRVAIRRRVERVEAHEHGTRLFLVPEPDEHVREADDHVRGPSFCAPNLLRERVVRAMRERVAVDGEQRLHSVASSRAISAISRSVASWAASRGSAERRSSSGTGGP